jgi:hypothetical protein
MKPRVLLLLLCMSAMPDAWSAPPKNAVLVDHSKSTLIDASTAREMLAAAIPSRVWKLYPPKRWGYVSEVEGGVTSSGTCVVTARVMMMELTPTLKVMLYRPKQTSTAFDALPQATTEQCRALAKTKLQEAISSVVSSLVRD